MALVPWRFHHLGVAVGDISRAIEEYHSMFGYELRLAPTDDPVQRVRVCFLGLPGQPAYLELVAPLMGDSPVSAIAAKGGGAYHVCYEVPCVEEALVGLRGRGAVVVADPVPATAFGGRLIAWVYITTNELVEVLEAAPHG